MIIQGGFDFELLARPYLFDKGTMTGNLLLITADRDLELYRIRLITDLKGQSLEPFADEILSGLEDEEDRYFGIAHTGQCQWGPDEHLMNEGQTIVDQAEPLGCRLIAHIVPNDESWMSMRGNSYFELYVDSYADLPSTMSNWSHSEYSQRA